MNYEIGYLDQGDMVFDYNEDINIADGKVENVVISDWATNLVLESDKDSFDESNINLLISSVSKIANREIRPEGGVN